MTTNGRPVASAATQVLAHAPGLARHGSKPRRELAKSADVEKKFLASLRSFDDAVTYLPHQAFINAMHPRDLPERPWVGRHTEEGEPTSRFSASGELMPETELMGLLAAVDHFDLLTISPEIAEQAAAALADHPLGKRLDLDRLEKATGDFESVAAEEGSLPVHVDADTVAGGIRTAQDDDESLAAHVMLENLCGKATGSLALLHLLEKYEIDPDSIDYVLSCGEEAVGDRYQRGGGNMAKAIAQIGGLSRASGADVKNFCAAPIPALVVASSLVSSGVFERVLVVAGGSLAKLGMKFQGHLKKDVPVLEDVLGGAAALIQRDDGKSPQVRLDGVGRHPVAAGGSNPAIVDALALQPLRGMGLTTTDIDDYGTELHNPEITEPQGSGNVPERNYKTIAALAAKQGDIERDDIPQFMAERGMPGYAPTQGHIASALCYLPHALGRLTTGDANRVMLMAKGSLFLGRMCELSDGMSVVLERNQGGD